MPLWVKVDLLEAVRDQPEKKRERVRQNYVLCSFHFSVCSAILFADRSIAYNPFGHIAGHRNTDSLLYSLGRLKKLKANLEM